MHWSDIPRNADTRMLRQFAGLWTLFFGSMACWHGFVGGRTGMAIVLAVLASGVGLAGMIYPRRMRPIFVGATVATFPIGWLTSRAMLACLYYGVFTPFAIVFRLRGRDALDLRGPARASYWVLKETPVHVKTYFQQY